MAVAILKFREDDARTIRRFLATKYGKRKDTSLVNLCMIAVRREVAEQAKVELDEAMEKFDEEGEETNGNSNEK